MGSSGVIWGHDSIALVSTTSSFTNQDISNALVMAEIAMGKLSSLPRRLDEEDSRSYKQQP